VQLATEEAKNFRDKNIFITLIPNKTEVQKPQETPKKAEADEVSVSVEA
jgi:translation initiation factor IF-3